MATAADLLDAVAVDLPDDAGEEDRMGAAYVGVLRPVRSFSDEYDSCLDGARCVDEEEVTVGLGVDWSRELVLRCISGGGVETEFAGE